MAVREPTVEELRAAYEIEGLESAVAQAKTERTKTRARDPLVQPDVPEREFTLQDMMDVQIPKEPAEEKKAYPGPLARPRGKAAVRGGQRLASRVEPLSSVQKATSRLALETGLGLAAYSRFGPPGAAIGATSKFIRALPPTARAYAVAYPRLARGIQSFPYIFGGEAAGSLLSESFDPSVGSPIGRAVTTGFVGSTAEFFVPGFARAGEMLRRGGFALNAGAREVVKKLMREGQTISPGYFSNNFAIQVLDNVASGSMFGGGHMRRAQLGGTQVMQESAKDFVKAFRTFASDSVEVQDMTRQLLQGRADAWRLVAKKKFGVIDELTKEGVRVDISPLYGSLSKVLKEAGGENAAGPLIKEIERLKSVGSIRPDGTMTFESAADLRSFMLGLQRAGPDQMVPGRQKKLGADLAHAIDRQMEESFRGLLPQSGLPAAELKRAWREANAFWKIGLEDFNSTLIKTLTKTEPRQVALAIRGNTANIRRVKRLMLKGIEGVRGTDEVITEGGLTGKQVWNEIQGEIINDMAAKSTAEVADTPVFMGSKMLRKLRTNKEQMTELLGQDGYNNALKLFRQVQLAQGGAVESNLPGKVFITFKQAGAISEVGGMMMGVGAGVSGTAVALLAGPYTMARLLTNPQFTKWALLGLNPKTPTAKFTRAVTDMFALALKEGATVEEVEQSPEESARVRRPIAPFTPSTLAGPDR